MTEFCRTTLDIYGDWGYVIFRTVYTPESDDLWPHAMEILNKAARADVDANFSNSPDDVRDRIKDSLRNDVFQDRDALANASIGQVRQYLRIAMEQVMNTQDNTSARTIRHYLNKDEGEPFLGDYPRWKCFIVIDEDSLGSIISAPDDLYGSMPESEDMEKHWVTIVDQGYDPASPGNPPWSGMMKMSFILSLYLLWEELRDAEEIEKYSRKLDNQGLSVWTIFNCD